MSLVLSLLASLTLLAEPSANPLDPDAVPPEPLVGHVHVGSELRAAQLLCEHGHELLFLEPGQGKTPPTLRALDRERDQLTRALPLAQPYREPEYDCGAGSCYFDQDLPSADGKASLELSGRKSLYYGSWLPQISFHLHPADKAWTGICAGERLLLLCQTARRTVQVSLGGDVNDPGAVPRLEYLATTPFIPSGVEGQGPRLGKETLHLVRGRVVRHGASYEATFKNKGFTYRLTTTADESQPSVLTVGKGTQAVQSEPCLGVAVLPAHLDWATTHVK